MKQIAIILSTTFFLYNCGNNKLVIESPKDSTTTENNEIIIKGVIPTNHYLYINSTKISGKTQFSKKFKLDKRINYFKFQTFRNGETFLYDENILITIFRRFSEDEEKIIEQKELAKKQRIVKEEKIKYQKQLTEERAWNKSKAGHIFNKHPEWSKEECEKIAKNYYWIGMTYGMLVYQHGRPDSKNPSNYGNGTSWQYCWYNMTPSCFYDTNSDGRIDSYN